MVATVFCAFLLVLVSFSYGEDTISVRYSEATFEANIAESAHFVMFFAPWCGHCKALSPTWEDLAAKHNTKTSDSRQVIIAKVDCTVDTGLCSTQDVTGYPTLKFFKPGVQEGVRYRGARDLASLEQFIQEQMGDVEDETVVEAPKPQFGLVELDDDTFHKHVETGSHFVKFYAPWCGHCQRLLPVWEQLARTFEFDSTVSISKLDCTSNRVSCNDFEVKGYPTLLWIKDGKKVEKYQGSRTHEDLKHFVSKMKDSSEADTASEDGKIPDLSQSPVIQLTEENFDKVLGTGLTFVKFFAPWCGHCQRLAPTWDELGKKFLVSPTVKIAKVDCSVETEKELCNKNKVEGYPSLVLFRDGQRVEEYNAPRDLAALHTFVMNHLGHDEL